MMRRALHCVLLALWACTAHAHRGGESQLVLTLAAERISGDWEIALNDLAPMFQLGTAADDPATAGALVAAHPELAEHALSRLRLSADGQRCRIGPATRRVVLRPAGPTLLLHFEARCAEAPRRLTVAYGLLFDIDPRHQGLLKLQSGELIRPAVFTAESAEQVFTLRDPGVWERATSDLRFCIWHIWTGFVLGGKGQAACSCGPRAGALGGALACRPRCVRIFSITGCSRIAAMIFNSPPQCAGSAPSRVRTPA